MSTLYGMPGIETITSAANPLVKDVRRAAQRGSLTTDGLCIAEGFHLLEEALRSGCATPLILASESAAERVGRKTEPILHSKMVVVEERLFQTLATTETTQGVIALVRLPEWKPAELFEAPAMVLILDGIQDPGNVGAIIRAAEGFGATGVLMGKGTARLFNPKTVRASMGSVFRVPFLPGLPSQKIAEVLREQQVDVYSAMPWTGRERPARHADLSRPCAITIGGEGNGIAPELRALGADISVPTSGVESLNAAIAASVLLYEVRRQRA